MATEKKTIVKDTQSIETAVEPKPKSIPETKKVSGESAGFCVYIGPSIFDTIQNGTIYRGSKEEVLATIAPAVEAYPLIASLVIPGDTLPVSQIKVKTPGNLLYVNYHKLASGKK